MEKKTTTALKRYLPTGGHGRWIDSHFSWNGHVCATDGFGALAIPEASDAVPGDPRGLAIVFRDSDRLDAPVMFRIEDIEEALEKWPEALPNSRVKVQDPQANEDLIGLEFEYDTLVTFRMVEMKRLCQTAKTLKCSVVTVTHASAAHGIATGYCRGMLGEATVVVMPCMCTDTSLPHRISPYVPEGSEWVEGWHVMMEGGVLVGYKSTSTGINRVVTTATNPDEFKRQVTRPRKEKAPVSDGQTSLMEMIDEVVKEA